MVLNNYDGMTFIDKPVKHISESGDVLLVQADCRLFNKVEICINWSLNQ